MAGFGLSKTDNHLFGMASVMIGPVADLFKLGKSQSIGLVKNVKLGQDSTFSDLLQGTQGSIVNSMRSAAGVRLSWEAFEFTAKNMAWGLSVDGSSVATNTVATTASGQVVGDNTTAVVPFTSVTGISVDDWVVIYNSAGSEEDALVRKVVSIASLNVTVNAAIPTGITIPSGAVIKKVNVIKMADKSAQPPFVSAKIIGDLANGETIQLLLPKIRITKGFELMFGAEWGNLPFESTAYDTVSTDTFYSTFLGASGMAFAR